ncbi:MAG: ATP-binding protein involved in chromosome partitioning [Oleiphilaceae bacterium]|jgi:ATP-binding protein involved in chromosome partitioning
MSNLNKTELEEAIKVYRDPYLNQDLFSLKTVKKLECEDGKVIVNIEMPYACGSLLGGIKQILETNLEYVDGVESVEINITCKIAAHSAQKEVKSIDGVKNIIAVASGKGGVGKSTTSVNFALALAQEGARVGIIDADIYGPSMGMMLGIPDGQRPETADGKWFVPIPAHGIVANSMAFLVDNNTPMVWRGPKVSGALLQLVTQTKWNNLDYLIVDLPPGTGDIQLTLAQRVPVTGAIIVTTPQDIALLDCKKGIEMFRKVDIDVLGVIENMSVHICSNCGHHEPLFGEGGGHRIAQAYDTEVLGEMPLHKTIREQTDAGNPTVVAEPDSEVAHLYRDIARKASALISQKPIDTRHSFPNISISNL